MKPMNIAVGISGGVDSSVTAYLLQQAGHRVTGVMMSIRDRNTPGEELKKDSCFGPDEKEKIREAEKFCQQIGIPFYVFDCADEFRNNVLAYVKKEYLSGRTPNPCIRCNESIKFGVLIEAVKKTGISFDLFATGHYARVEGDVESRKCVLKRAKDLNKDQSYFLYRLSPELLSSLFFPLGYYTKERVREIAWKEGFASHKRKESQDFYGGSYAELLDVEEKPGNIIDTSGKILGTHKGIWHYTRGQRRGLGIAAGKPLYVIDIHPGRNEITAGYEEESYNRGFIAQDVHWITFPQPEREITVTTKLRSTQTPKKATLFPVHEKRVKVILHAPQKAITPGQSAVFYIDDRVLGGGIIDSVF
jgi:tRNA-uridine 2-sulfurtransferase